MADVAQAPAAFLEAVRYYFPVIQTQRSPTSEILRREENFACVRIFYCGSRRKTSDVDVTAI